MRTRPAFQPIIIFSLFLLLSSEVPSLWAQRAQATRRPDRAFFVTSANQSRALTVDSHGRNGIFFSKFDKSARQKWTIKRDGTGTYLLSLYNGKYLKIDPRTGTGYIGSATPGTNWKTEPAREYPHSSEEIPLRLIQISSGKYLADQGEPGLDSKGQVFTFIPTSSPEIAANSSDKTEIKGKSSGDRALSSGRTPQPQRTPQPTPQKDSPPKPQPKATPKPKPAPAVTHVGLVIIAEGNVDNIRMYTVELMNKDREVIARGKFGGVLCSFANIPVNQCYMIELIAPSEWKTEGYVGSSETSEGPPPQKVCVETTPVTVKLKERL